MVTFTRGSRLKNRSKSLSVRVRKPASGNSSAEAGLLIAKGGDGWLIYDDVCDHNGGRLRLDPNQLTATCPVHGWRLKLFEAKYENGCPKARLSYVDAAEQLVVEKRAEEFPEIDRSGLSDAPVDLVFNAHASVSLQIGDFSLITDPWFEGPCFATGWWHLYPPTPNAIERLMQSDVVYISHIHPDHLHLPTLRKYVPRSKLFLIPRFESGSVERVLRENGFDNILAADFMEEIRFRSANGLECKALILKAGDNRDDSSLIITTGNTAILFGVDTNMPNRWVLPEVDVLFASFAGGASGYPSRIDNLKDTEKLAIAERNRGNMLGLHLSRLIRETRPKLWVPYAGYFTVTGRDQDVDQVNLKNNRKRALEFVARRFPGITGIDPIEVGQFKVHGPQLLSPTTLAMFSEPSRVTEADNRKEIDAFSRGAPEMNADYLDRLGRAFVDSAFMDNLTLAVVACADDFAPSLEFFLVVNFSSDARGYALKPLESSAPEMIAAQLRKTTDNNIEVMRVREDSLRGVLLRGLPLEDLSIGFQIRMYRDPNVYNFDFWNYFTNVANLRLNTPDCNSLRNAKAV